MSEGNNMPLEIWTDINGIATQKKCKGSVKYIRADEHKRLREALVKLSFAAQITGGTAGRDEQLCDAIAFAEAALTPQGGKGGGK